MENDCLNLKNRPQITAKMSDTALMLSTMTMIWWTPGVSANGSMTVCVRMRKPPAAKSLVKANVPKRLGLPGAPTGANDTVSVQTPVAEAAPELVTVQVTTTGSPK
jgi:hypothetical protein